MEVTKNDGKSEDESGDMVFGFFFFQAEDGIRGSPVTEFRRVLFRS